jgi:hypothetical protein
METFNIEIKAGLKPNNNQKIWLSGRLNLPLGKNGVPDSGAQVLKHIILVATRSGNYQSLAPFKNVAVFPDDFAQKNNECAATFNIQVMDHLAFDGAGDYYLLCSVGQFLSNIVKVTVPES